MLAGYTYWNLALGKGDHCPLQRMLCLPGRNSLWTTRIKRLGFEEIKDEQWRFSYKDLRRLGQLGDSGSSAGDAPQRIAALKAPCRGSRAFLGLCRNFHLVNLHVWRWFLKPSRWRFWRMRSTVQCLDLPGVSARLRLALSGRTSNNLGTCIRDGILNSRSVRRHHRVFHFANGLFHTIPPDLLVDPLHAAQQSFLLTRLRNLSGTPTSGGLYDPIGGRGFDCNRVGTRRKAPSLAREEDYIER